MGDTPSMLKIMDKWGYNLTDPTYSGNKTPFYNW